VYLDEPSEAGDARAALLRAQLDGVELSRISISIESADSTFDALNRTPEASIPNVILAPNYFSAVGAFRWMKEARRNDKSLIFAMHSNPLQFGMADSFQRPSRGATGVTYAYERDPKNLDAIRHYQPHAKRLGVLIDGEALRDPQFLNDTTNTMASGGIQTSFLRADTTFEQAAPHIDAMIRSGIKSFDGFDFSGGLGDHHRILQYASSRGALVYTNALDLLEKGCFFAIEPVLQSPYKIWARQVELVLSGFPVGEIPIEQPTIFRRGINRTIAKRAGLNLPLSHYATFDVIID
jgi:ABC-type uncharacterized transport system substrate-binding protein